MGALTFTCLPASLLAARRVRTVLVGEYNQSWQSELCWMSAQLDVQLCSNTQINVGVDATETFAKDFFFFLWWYANVHVLFHLRISKCFRFLNSIIKLYFFFFYGLGTWCQRKRSRGTHQVRMLGVHPKCGAALFIPESHLLSLVLTSSLG